LACVYKHIFANAAAAIMIAKLIVEITVDKPDRVGLQVHAIKLHWNWTGRERED